MHVRRRRGGLHPLLVVLWLIVAGILQGALYLFVAYYFLGRARADYFYPSGDILRCDFVPAVGIGIVSLPTDIRFLRSQVRGGSYALLKRVNILDLVDVRIGRVKRYDKYAFVAVPPSSKIGFCVYGYNFAGHPVNMRQVWMPISYRGALNKVLELPRDRISLRRVRVIYAGKLLEVKGGFLRIASNLTCPYDKRFGAGGCRYCSQDNIFTVREPVQVEKVQVACELSLSGEIKKTIRVCFVNKYGALKEVLAIAVRTANVDDSSRYIRESNMVVQRGEGRCLNIRLNYPDMEEDPYTLLRYSRLSEDEVCLAHKDSRGDSFDLKSRVIFVERGDFGHPDWTAVQPGFASIGNKDEPFFCIKRLPYSKVKPIPKCKFKRKVLLEVSPGSQVHKVGESAEVFVSVRNLGPTIKRGEIALRFTGEIGKYLKVVNGEEIYFNLDSPLVLRVENLKFNEIRSFKLRLLFTKRVDIYKERWRLDISAGFRENNSTGIIAQDNGLVEYEDFKELTLGLQKSCLFSDTGNGLTRVAFELNWRAYSAPEYHTVVLKDDSGVILKRFFCRDACKGEFVLKNVETGRTLLAEACTVYKNVAFCDSRRVGVVCKGKNLDFVWGNTSSIGSSANSLSISGKSDNVWGKDLNPESVKSVEKSSRFYSGNRGLKIKHTSRVDFGSNLLLMLTESSEGYASKDKIYRKIEYIALFLGSVLALGLVREMKLRDSEKKWS